VLSNWREAEIEASNGRLCEEEDDDVEDVVGEICLLLLSQVVGADESVDFAQSPADFEEDDCRLDAG